MPLPAMLNRARPMSPVNAFSSFTAGIHPFGGSGGNFFSRSVLLVVTVKFTVWPMSTAALPRPANKARKILLNSTYRSVRAQRERRNILPKNINKEESKLRQATTLYTWVCEIEGAPHHDPGAVTRKGGKAPDLHSKKKSPPEARGLHQASARQHRQSPGSHLLLRKSAARITLA